MKPKLFRFFLVLRAALAQPFAGRQIENHSKRSVSAARFALQPHLEIGRDAPTVYFGLHALHRSAFGFRGISSVTKLTPIAG